MKITFLSFCFFFIYISFAQAQSDYIGQPLSLVKMKIKQDFPSMELNLCSSSMCEYWLNIDSSNSHIKTMLLKLEGSSVKSVILTIDNSQLADYLNRHKELPLDCELSQGGDYVWVGSVKVFGISIGKDDFTYYVTSK